MSNVRAKQVEQTDWASVQARSTIISRAALLKLAVELSYQVPGNIVEFGVASGGSTRVLRSTADKMERYYGGAAKKRIFGCDSFEGLPETYEGLEVGHFAGAIPKIANVEFVKGYYEDSLTPEFAQRVGQVALASLDADLFSSTKCALNWLTPLLGSGSLLLFDEFIGEEEAEKRAFEEWSTEKGIRTIQLAYVLREPSGNGHAMDARALYQVIGPEPLDRVTARWDIKSRVKGALRPDSGLYRSARRAYRRWTGKPVT